VIRWSGQGERRLLDRLRSDLSGRLAQSARAVTGAPAAAIRSDGRQVVVDDPDLLLREYGAPGIDPEPWAMEAIGNVRTHGGRDE
jgi:hypothetical protein